jgi:hypothetical protein
MFDKVGQIAERMATNVSRRAFMGRLGKGALAVAGAMGAMLAFPGLVQAGRTNCFCVNGGSFICQYSCNGGITVYTTLPIHNTCTCATQYKRCPLIAWGCTPPP